jgi:hypothetical protein
VLERSGSHLTVLIGSMSWFLPGLPGESSRCVQMPSGVDLSIRSGGCSEELLEPPIEVLLASVPDKQRDGVNLDAVTNEF